MTLAILTAIFFSPVQSIASARDSATKQNIGLAMEALRNYAKDNEGTLPTAKGQILPEVTPDNVLNQGVNLADVENLWGQYLQGDKTTSELKVGRTKEGEPLVSGTLQSGKQVLP